MLPPHNIQKYSLTFPEGKTQPGWSHLDRQEGAFGIFEVHLSEVLTVILTTSWSFQKLGRDAVIKWGAQNIDVERLYLKDLNKEEVKE
jgi:hypothetical protein